MAMSTDACWGGHFCVEQGIFVSNRAFLCQTMHFAVESGLLCRTRVIIINKNPIVFSVPVCWHAQFFLL